MNDMEIYNEILPELYKILSWCKNPIAEQDFDLDNVYHKIFLKYDISIDFGFLYPIFLLIDNLYDSIGHQQSELMPGYKVEEGIEDLKKIIHLIEQKQIIQLENDIALKGRIYKLNSQY
jgi:hypothetical protein